MSFLLVFHFTLGLAAGAAGWFWGNPLIGLSVAAGAAFSLLNLVFLTLVWPKVFVRKQLALALGVTVFKFAILGWILYEVVRGNYLSIGWFSVGMGLIVVSVVVSALQPSNSN